MIGRTRLVPTDILPPLRAETLALLASVKTDSLAQSYERNRVFAGRYVKDWDWAPILLSAELMDTEYGNLLNITDQILKSWSLNGLIEYERFNDYPKPTKWPFAKPLDKEIGGKGLTFNWNTAGSGYAISDETATWFALNRSGALPVTYIPEGAKDADRTKTAKFEEQAYDYFSSSGDPNLARVVSYAGAYQIFRHYRPAKEAPEPDTAAQVRGHDLLAKRAREALRDLLDAVGDKVVAVAKKLATRMGKSVFRTSKTSSAHCWNSN